MKFLSALLFCVPIIHQAVAAPSCQLQPASSSSSAPVPQSSTPASSGNNTTGTANNGTIVAAAWYPGWESDTFPPSKISWDKYSIMTYSFAITTPDVNTLSLEDSDVATLPTFVQLAHQHNVEALVSIGGWTGSIYYSNMVATAENRTAFVKTVLNLVKQYNLDGVDFDWEYPGKQGIGCNSISPDDSANFLEFLKELRADPAGQNLTLTSATGIAPYAGADGNPMTDVSEFAKYLTYVAIMNYDIWGQWSSTVGPNAPLDDACATGADQQQGSATGAVKAWKAAGFPANQLVLGVAAYGHSFHVDPSTAVDSQGSMAAYPKFTPNTTIVGNDQCGNPTTADDDLNFVDLIAQGYLTSNGTVANGMTYRFDNCSQTPYVYNPTTQLMVSYDDATSFAAKGKFVLENGLAGFAMWDVTGDSTDILLDSITTALGVTGDVTGDDVDC